VLGVQIRERLVGDVEIRKPLHEVAGAWPGDVHRGEGAGHVDDLGVHAPDGVPPLEPLDHRTGAGRGSRHVVGVVSEPGDRAVIHDPPRIGVEDAVADAARLHVAEAVGIEPFEELGRLGADDEQLAEGGDVDHADSAVDRLHFTLDVAVRVRPAPGARPHHPRAELLVTVVDGRALSRLVRAAREDAERHRAPWRPRRRCPDRARV
jgi:hypothetical protein